MAHQTPKPKSNNLQETSSHIPDEKDSSGIINRKIERRGLPSSFSSNLVNPRDSPPNKDAASSGKLVKSMVQLFESSKSSKSVTTSTDFGDGESAKSKATTRVTSTAATSASNTALVHQQHQHQQQIFVGAPDVEDYSLTFLKYRQYFTNRPLGRCLDGQGKEEQVKIYSDDQLEISKKPQDPTTETPESKPLPASKDAKPLSGKEQEDQLLSRRDPQVVAAYWNHIRNYLWIPDKELEETRQAKRKASATPRSLYLEQFPAMPDEPMRSPPLPPIESLRDTHRTDSDASQRSLDEQKRRLAVTQKHITELDDYIISSSKKQSFAQEVFPSSPTSAVPSPPPSPTVATFAANARAISSRSHEHPRCTSCSKIRVSSGESSYRGSVHSSSVRPPQRAPMNLSRGNSGRIREPPVLGEEEQDRNFF